MIPKEAKECWYHSIVNHYCLVEPWTQDCIYPDCRKRDFETGELYYKVHKKVIKNFDPIYGSEV